VAEAVGLKEFQITVKTVEEVTELLVVVIVYLPQLLQELLVKETLVEQLQAVAEAVEAVLLLLEQIQHPKVELLEVLELHHQYQAHQ
jgi:hypothetical protein